MPYKINDIYKAAEWVLQGVNASSMVAVNAPIGSIVSTTPESIPSHAHDHGFVKTEQLGSILTKFSKTIVDAINMASHN